MSATITSRDREMIDTCLRCTRSQCAEDRSIGGIKCKYYEKYMTARQIRQRGNPSNSRTLIQHSAGVREVWL